jgi:transcriptional regulator with XRE-family HTH domain
MLWYTKIKQIRESKGLTQQEVSDRTGLDVTHYSHIENGYYKSLKDEYRTKLAQAFGMTTSEFSTLIYSDEPIPKQTLPELIEELKTILGNRSLLNYLLLA